MKDKTLMECNLAMTKSCRLSDIENKEEALKIVENMAEKVIIELIDCINPLSKDSTIFIIPALRYIANSLEKEMTDYDKGISEYIESFFQRTGTSEVVKENS